MEMNGDDLSDFGSVEGGNDSKGETIPAEDPLRASMVNGNGVGVGSGIPGAMADRLAKKGLRGEAINAQTGVQGTGKALVDGRKVGKGVDNGQGGVAGGLLANVERGVGLKVLEKGKGGNELNRNGGNSLGGPKGGTEMEKETSRKVVASRDGRQQGAEVGNGGAGRTLVGTGHELRADGGGTVGLEGDQALEMTQEEDDGLKGQPKGNMGVSGGRNRWIGKKKIWDSDDDEEPLRKGIGAFVTIGAKRKAELVGKGLGKAVDPEDGYQEVATGETRGGKGELDGAGRGGGVVGDGKSLRWIPDEATLRGMWTRDVESGFSFAGGVMLMLKGLMLWDQQWEVDGVDGVVSRVRDKMRWNVRVLVQGTKGLEPAGAAVDVPNFWIAMDQREARWTMGDEGEDWVEYGRLVESFKAGCIRVQGEEDWFLMWTGQGLGNAVLELADELMAGVKEFGADVVKKKVVVVETPPLVLLMSTGPKVQARWMIISGVWEEYPDGELEEAMINRVIRDVVRACRGMGDGVVAKVDEEELRVRCGSGKVFFMPKGRDLGVFEVRAYRFALVRLSEEVEVGVDKKGNGKVFSKLDIGNGVRKATVYRQFLVEEEANICMDMMETATGDVDNLIVGVRGFVRADEYDEYLRRNAVRMFGRMGMKVFGLMTLVSKVDLKVELIMLVISMGRIGGSQLRTAFGWKKGTSFSKVGGLVGGLSVELVLHYDQVGRGKDVRQDGPVIELEGEGAMDLGMDGVTTVLSPYGDLGVLGMARCILSVSAGAARWKVFVKPTEWEKLNKLASLMRGPRAGLGLASMIDTCGKRTTAG